MKKIPRKMREKRERIEKDRSTDQTEKWEEKISERISCQLNNKTDFYEAKGSHTRS